MKFFVLNSTRDKDLIVKADGRKHYEYSKSNGWVRSGIMSDYYLPYGVYYDMYKEISEEEAMNLIKRM